MKNDNSRQIKIIKSTCTKQHCTIYKDIYIFKKIYISECQRVCGVGREKGGSTGFLGQ